MVGKGLLSKGADGWDFQSFLSHCLGKSRARTVRFARSIERSEFEKLSSAVGGMGTSKETQSSWNAFMKEGVRRKKGGECWLVSAAVACFDQRRRGKAERSALRQGPPEKGKETKKRG